MRPYITFKNKKIFQNTERIIPVRSELSFIQIIKDTSLRRDNGY